MGKEAVMTKSDENNKLKSKTDWKKVDAMTDAEIESACAGDPDCPIPTDEELKEFKPALDHHLESLKEAFREHRKIKGTQLKDNVEIIHKDGSQFRTSKAFIVEKEKWIIVHSKFHLPQVFLKEHLKSWRQLNPPETGEGWHYQVMHDKKHETFQIHESIPVEKDQPNSYTEEAISPIGDTFEELISDLEAMIEDAKYYPVKELP